jgi:rare lipoprotein A
MRTFALLTMLTLSACAGGAFVPTPEPPPRPEPPPPEVAEPPAPPAGVPAGDRITPEPVPDTLAADVLESVEGEATYYASKFDGRRTASGVVFRNAEAYAAHRTYPFGTVVRVTNLRNDRSVILRVVDRGPFGNARRIIDVSQRAARELDFMSAGVVPVRVEVLEWGSRK